MTLLSVLIVSYNTRALTQKTIESVIGEIENSSVLKDTTDIWLIDNDSTDDSVHMVKHLQKTFSKLHLIENRKNVGFAAANNQAIEQSTGQYVLLLNSDTVVHPKSFELMVHTMMNQHPGQEIIENLGILSGQLVNPDGTTQPQGGSFPTLWSLASHMLFLDDLPLIGQFFPSTQHTGRSRHTHSARGFFTLDWVGGTAMMVKREVFAEVGVLDGNIFMYGEDIEFCLRAKHHHWKIGVLPTAQITHYGSASSSSKNAIIGELKGYLYIWSKHKPLWQKSIVKTLLQLGVYLRIFIFGTIIKNKAKAAIYREATLSLKN